MKILIADDHEVVRRGLAAWLSGWAVVEATSADAAVKIFKEHRPHVTLLDVRMPGDGLTALARIKAQDSDAVVVMFSGQENPTYIARSVALGARGYLLKSTPRKELVSAIKQAVDGFDIWPPTLIQQVTGELSAAPEIRGARLTKREGEVLKQLALGLSNKEIAQALGISYETVKEHVQHILWKLQVLELPCGRFAMAWSDYLVGYAYQPGFVQTHQFSVGGRKSLAAKSKLLKRRTRTQSAT